MKKYQKIIVYSALVAGSLGLLNGCKKVYEGSEVGVNVDKVAILSDANVINNSNLEQTLKPYNEARKYQGVEECVEKCIDINQVDKLTPTSTTYDKIFKYVVSGGIVLSCFMLIGGMTYTLFFPLSNAPNNRKYWAKHHKDKE